VVEHSLGWWKRCPWLRQVRHTFAIWTNSLKPCASAWQRFERSELYVCISSGDILSLESDHASNTERSAWNFWREECHASNCRDTARIRARLFLPAGRYMCIMNGMDCDFLFISAYLARVFYFRIFERVLYHNLTKAYEPQISRAIIMIQC
jgi:hypothetical protein